MDKNYLAICDVLRKVIKNDSFKAFDLINALALIITDMDKLLLCEKELKEKADKDAYLYHVGAVESAKYAKLSVDSVLKAISLDEIVKPYRR